MVRYVDVIEEAKLLVTEIEDPFNMPFDPAAKAVKPPITKNGPRITKAQQPGTEKTGQTTAGAAKAKVAQAFTDKVVLRPQDIQTIKSKPGFNDASSAFLAQRDYEIKQFGKFPYKVAKGDALFESSLTTFQKIDSFTGKAVPFTVAKSEIAKIENGTLELDATIEDDPTFADDIDARMESIDQEGDDVYDFFTELRDKIKSADSKIGLGGLRDELLVFLGRAKRRASEDSDMLYWIDRAFSALAIEKGREQNVDQQDKALARMTSLILQQLRKKNAEKNKLYVSSKAAKATKNTRYDMSVEGQKVPVVVKTFSVQDARTGKQIELKKSDIVIETQFKHFLNVRYGGKEMDWWVFVKEDQVAAIETNSRKVNVMTSTDAAPFSELAQRASDLYTRIFRDPKFPSVLDLGKYMTTKNIAKQQGA